jgi:hypothetical protein
LLLRASGAASGDAYDLRAVRDDDHLKDSGIDHAEELIALTEALVGENDETLNQARARAVDAVGPEATHDAIAVASNFERMVRIADSTGIPLDAPLEAMSQGLRRDLDLARFGSSRNTPEASSARRLLGRILEPALPTLVRVFQAMGRRRGR